MADLLGKGAAFLHAKLIANASRPVLYRRGAQEATVQATIGRTLFRFDQDGGVTIRVETRDYLVAPGDLGALFPPQSGDQVDETVDGITTTFEVTGPGGEPEWRWSGPDRQRMRIHSKRISAQA